MNRNILIINGPNLNLTGTRKPEIYGSTTLTQINERIARHASEKGLTCNFYQSNHEGAIIDKIHEARGVYAGVIINAGAYSHYSYAIRDAIEAVELPFIEVHLSNIFARDEFRSKSVLSAVCRGHISGFGADSYLLGVEALALVLDKQAAQKPQL
ncbi:type II 3-dehydroquinate dehydratase [Acetanaerobacterium elongatum]|uniref:3-dehydroquinate dehydratase n=1 Tax=Acetanaerobacterium elongatum TaxID=258515 RepID=A0A1H0DN51_9FIRM|nr:type II 3-dehydroquinate dehydratase [Acetanaerobacterium elongatum]SDN71498.1 3-dehydroquinate dehydratase [Acetanaerobacterium elongatum]